MQHTSIVLQAIKKKALADHDSVEQSTSHAMAAGCLSSYITERNLHTSMLCDPV